MKKFFIAIFLIGALITWFIVYQTAGSKGMESTIDFIASHISGNGKIVDYQNDLGIVDTKIDIQWYDEDENIEIKFGKVKFDIKKEDLLTEYVKEQLGRINMEVRQSKEDGEIKIYYAGEVVDLYIQQ